MRNLLAIISMTLIIGCTHPAPVCRHNVVGDALFIGETYPVYQIAVDPTISKHAQVRYFDRGTWHWYHEVDGWVPEGFNPVLFFDVEDYIVWYKANYHKLGVTYD